MYFLSHTQYLSNVFGQGCFSITWITVYSLFLFKIIIIVLPYWKNLIKILLRHYLLQLTSHEVNLKKNRLNKGLKRLQCFYVSFMYSIWSIRKLEATFLLIQKLFLEISDRCKVLSEELSCSTYEETSFSIIGTLTLNGSRL